MMAEFFLNRSSAINATADEHSLKGHGCARFFDYSMIVGFVGGFAISGGYAGYNTYR